MSLTDDMLEIIFRDRIRFESLHSAAMHHELQTPLVIIRGLAESLLRKPSQDPQAQLREIANEAARLLKILDSMAFLSPSEPLQMQRISVRSVIDQVVIFFEKTCLDKGISIRVDVDENILIESEPHRLKSILSALIQNAIESFENKSTRDAKSITIHLQESGGKKHLIISDNGVGMSLDMQKEIRENILSNKGPRKHGLGLGLVLVKKIATDLSIGLSFVSEAVRGTSFTLKFEK